MEHRSDHTCPLVPCMQQIEPLTIISIENAKTVELCKYENNSMKSQIEFEFNQTFD
jgi:hypothetical protein